MKNIFKVTPFLVFAIIFNVSVKAEDTPKYPGENFVPYVIYQDSKLIEQLGGGSVKQSENKDIKVSTLESNKSRQTTRELYGKGGAWDMSSNSISAKVSNQPVSAEPDALPLGVVGLVALLIFWVAWISRGGVNPDIQSEPEAVNTTEPPEFFVQANWDDQKKAWIATIDSIPGLEVEATTTEALVGRLNVELPGLLDERDIDYSSPITFQLQSEMTSVASGS